MTATLTLASAGGGLASLTPMPLPWLLGAQLAVCAAAVAGWRFFGAPPQWPERSRLLFMPVLGVMIGGSFSAELLGQIPGWWPSVLALFAFLIVAHWAVFLLYRRLGPYDTATAFYAAAPGGFIESVILGGEAGGNPSIIAAQQFSRLLVAVFLIPVAFTLVLGEAVGSASGASFARAGARLDWPDIAMLTAAAVIGGFLGRRLKLPAGILSGPAFLAAALHISGLTDAQPPNLLVNITQLVVGITLGVRFVGMAKTAILRAIWLSTLGVSIMLVIAAAFALAVAGLSGTGFPALILAFAPGGLAEMSLIALSLHLPVAFVTIHHLLRITFALTVVPFQYRRIVTRLFPDRDAKGG